MMLGTLGILGIFAFETLINCIYEVTARRRPGSLLGSFARIGRCGAGGAASSTTGTFLQNRQFADLFGKLRALVPAKPRPATLALSLDCQNTKNCQGKSWLQLSAGQLDHVLCQGG